MPSYVLKTGAFTPQFCEKALVEMRKKVKMKPAGTLRDNNVRRDIRRSSVGWPDRADHEFIHEADKIAREINQKHWKFALDGDGEYQLTHYAVEDKGVYTPTSTWTSPGMTVRASARSVSWCSCRTLLTTSEATCAWSTSERPARPSFASEGASSCSLPSSLTACRPWFAASDGLWCHGSAGRLWFSPGAG